MKKLVLGLAVAFALVGASSASAYTFNTNLTLGSAGADVVALQDMLIAGGHLVMPAGVSKGYFGALTQTAVAKWQAANGIAPAAGYFGPVSRMKASSSVSTPSNPVVTPVVTGLSGGDGDFKDFDVLGNPDSTDVEEGATEEVLGFEFDAEDSDLLVERLDVLFAETGSDTDKPWKVLETLTLSIGGKEVAEIDASDSDVWSEEENDEYSVRFDDIDTVVKDGKSVKVYLSVTAQDDLDTADQGNWSVEIMQDGLRALNAEGINVYEAGNGADDDIDSDSDERDFSLEAAAQGDLTISVDTDDNEDRVVEVDDDNETNDEVLYVAQVESQEGTVNVEEVTVTIATTTGTADGLSDFITTLYLFIDGEEVGSETVSDDDGSEAIVFDDIDVDIDEDEEVDFEVRADFDNQDGNYAATTTPVGVYVDAIAVAFVDAQDDDRTETDSTNGGNVTLSVDALMVEVASIPSAVSPLANDESKGRFFVEFTVAAPSTEDIYIPYGATTSTSVTSGLGAEFIVVNNAGVTQTTATTTDTNNVLRKVSGASDTGSYYKITKGNTGKFSLEVVVDNTGASAARTLGIQLTGVNYKVGSAATPDTQFNAGLDEDFRSDTEYLLTANTSN